MQKIFLLWQKSREICKFFTFIIVLRSDKMYLASTMQNFIHSYYQNNMRLCQIFSRHIDIQSFDKNYLSSIWFYLYICIPWIHALNKNNLIASHWKKLKQILIIMAKLLQKRFKQITLKSFISKQKKVFLICSVLLKKIDVAFICGSQFLFKCFEDELEEKLSLLLF